MKRKEKWPAKRRLFVAEEEGAYLCSDCIPASLDLGDPAVEVWEEFSDGWTGPCVCRVCKLSIPVYVDGQEAEAAETADSAPRKNRKKTEAK